MIKSYNYLEGIGHLGGSGYYLAEHGSKIGPEFAVNLAEHISIVGIRKTFDYQNCWVFEDMSGQMSGQICREYHSYLSDEELELLKNGLVPLEEIYWLKKDITIYDIKTRVVPVSSGRVKIISYYLDIRDENYFDWSHLYEYSQSWERI